MPSRHARYAHRFTLVAALGLLCAGALVASIAAAGGATVIDTAIYNVTLFALTFALTASAVALLGQLGNFKTRQSAR